MAGAAPIEVTEEQVLYFRARRGHLAGPGAASAVAAARAILGAQSQQLPPSLLALSQRTRGRPTAEALRRQLLGTRRLVRTWGQRDTLHVYDPAPDWALVVAARALWAPGGRGGPMPPEAALDQALARMKASEAPSSRTDLIDVAPRHYVRAVAERAGSANLDATRFAAGRLIWKLAHRGDVCVADKVGAEQTYATRSAWFPGLAWAPKTPLEAAAELARRYLATYGPATPADVAHFFGARVASVRTWLAAIQDRTVPVRCGERKGLLALRRDAGTLTAEPPGASAVAWPLRLLPLWESMLMAHADKSWTVSEEADRKLVWRKAAFVSAVVLDRGRVVATWSHQETRRALQVQVQPLSRWRARHAAGVRREAKAVAGHLGLDAADVAIVD